MKSRVINAIPKAQFKLSKQNKTPSRSPFSRLIFLLFVLSVLFLQCTKEEINEPPVSEPQSFTVSEASENGFVIGSIEASDPDGDALAFSISSGNTGDAFAFVENSGVLTIENSEVLDSENKPSYSLGVSISDGKSQISVNITIEITKAPNRINIKGVTQKGPFVSGSTVNVQQLDENLVPTGNSFSFETSNDFGEFEVNVDLTDDLIEVQTTGFYFNEIDGNISDANLSLRAISEVQSANPEINVNILTTLTKERIKTLLGQGSDFSEARTQSEKDILSSFGIEDAIDDAFISMDISKPGTKNAILLAISCILQENRSVGEFSELLSKLNLDLGSDGELSNENLQTIRESATQLNRRLWDITNNLKNRYTSLGLANVEVPNFSPYVVGISQEPLSIEVTPTDGAVNVNTDDIVMNFSSPISKENGSAISTEELKTVFSLVNNNTSQNQDFELELNEANTQLTLRGIPILNSGTTYTVSIKEPLWNIANSSIASFQTSFTTGVRFTFETIDTNLITEATSKESHIHYHEESNKVLIFDFFTPQIIEFDHLSGEFTTRAFSKPENISDIRSIQSQLLGDELHIDGYVFSLNTNEWSNNRVVDNPSLTDLFALRNYITLDGKNFYGISPNASVTGQTINDPLGLFKYSLESNTLELLKLFPSDDPDNRSFNIDTSNPILYNSEDNSLVMAIPSYNSIANETFYFEYSLSDNSIREIAKSTEFNEGYTDFRDGAALVYNSNQNTMIIYGGYGSVGVYHNDIWIYSFETSTWLNPENTGAGELKGGQYIKSTFVPDVNQVFALGGFGGGSADNNSKDFVRIQIR